MALDTLKLENYINGFYKKNDDVLFEKEKYKINALKYFRRNMLPYLEDESASIAEFDGIMEEAVSHFENLLYMGPHRGGRLDGADLLKQCASRYPKRMDRALRSLYRAGLKETDVLGAIECFDMEFRNMVMEFEVLEKPSVLTNIRVPALLLFFLFPEKYFFFMYEKYKYFRELVSYVPVSGKKPFENCQLMSAEILEIVEKDKELREKYKERVTLQLREDVLFEEFDPDYHMLVQDIIWSTYYYKVLGKKGTIDPPKRRIDEFIDEPKIYYPVDATETSSGGVDYVAMQNENSELGERGEEFVLQREWMKIKAKHPELLDKYPKWVSKGTNDAAGYDILSLDDEGKEIFIEVKTTKAGANNPFYFTRKELKVSIEHAEKYVLYRVFKFKDGEGDLYKYRGSLEKFCGQPVLYCVKMDMKKSKK